MKTATTLKLVSTTTLTPDDPLLQDLDDLVARASRGDRRAIGALAVAFGPALRGEARQALGKAAPDADDLLQELYVFLLEARIPYLPGYGRAIQWICGVIRVLADRWRDRRRRELYPRDEGP
jgi:DNA-directed RNA polymerase specialized sigma24 family protein